MEKKELIEKYFDMVYKLALSQTGDKFYGEDVTGEVFLKFMKSRKVFESEEHIKAWLIRVTVNTAKSIFTTSWHKKTVPLEEDIMVEMPEVESEVYEQVLNLPKKYKAVIHLFYYEDMSVNEISKALNINSSTVRSQLHRARAILKEKLKGEYDFVQEDI